MAKMTLEDARNVQPGDRYLTKVKGEELEVIAVTASAVFKKWPDVRVRDPKGLEWVQNVYALEGCELLPRAAAKVEPTPELAPPPPAKGKAKKTAPVVEEVVAPEPAVEPPPAKKGRARKASAPADPAPCELPPPPPIKPTTRKRATK